MGALFGVSAELTGVLRAGWGTIFGITVWLGAHVITVPLLRLSKARHSFRTSHGSCRIWYARAVWRGSRNSQTVAA